MSSVHPPSLPAAGTGAVPDPVYQRYRVHQKDLFKECMDDARMIVKRTGLPTGANEADSIVSLALTLFGKRCEAWADYRDANSGFRRASDP
jgi:hypothetical protein